MRYLVTGASGFLGRHCVAALSRMDFEVVALSRSGEPVAGAVESIACDLLDPVAVATQIERAGATCLIHLAWHADQRDRWHSLANLDWLHASIGLARAFAAAGGVRMVFGGSSAEYDWGYERLVENETPLRPASLYGAAKASVGLTLGAAAAELGIAFAHARIFFCYGPGEPGGRLVHDVIAGLVARRRVACSDGLQQRDYLHADDIGHALALVAASDVRGPINIASGNPTPVRDIIGALADLLDGHDLLDIGAIPRRPADPLRIYADVAQLTSLGFVRHFDLARGLRDTVEAYCAAEHRR